MFDILAITGPIYLVILVGFASTRSNWFAKTDMRVFGKFVVKLALPSLVFSALAQRQFREIFNVSYLLAYLAGSLAVVALGYAWCRRVATLTPTTSTIYVMGMACANSGFVGYPILLLMIAPVAGVSLALNMMVENIIMIPLLLALLERNRSGAGEWRQQLRQTLLSLVTNPLIIGLFAGLAISLLEWQLPSWLTRTITMFAMTSGALSLFVIGGSLVGLPMRGMARQVIPISIGKLVLHPTAVLLAILALPWLGLPTIDPSLRTAAVLMAAMPIMTIYPILAQPYSQENFPSAAVLITTISSFFTLSALLWILQHLSL